MNRRRRHPSGWVSLSARCRDVVLALLLGAVTAPVWLVAALAIRLTAGSPVIFRSRRVGRNGVEFVVFKFRTMRQLDGPLITAAGDDRVTPVGRWLRMMKIDELPQLWNVMRGEMSIVGPRPEDPRYVALYSDDQRCLLAVRPGITSPASIAYRHEEAILSTYPDRERAYIDLVLPAKLELDLVWLDSCSFVGDCRVIRDTARALLSGVSVDPRGPSQRATRASTD
jgi:lipopolysaccharide/colanic/teichoic acid biosynthesis glycosyltransferase